MLNDLKELLENALIWLLYKLNKTRLARLDIKDSSLTIGLSKIIPDNGKWYDIRATIQYHIKINENTKKVNIDDLAVFVNDRRKAKSRIKYSIA